VTFAGSATGGAAPYAYAWTFGDGGTATGTLSPAHTYGDSGSYTATLVVTDALGGTSQGSTAVTISNVAPTPTLSGAPASSAEGAAISLTASAADPSAADRTAGFTYNWSVTKNGGAFRSGNGSTWSFTPDDNGTYVATLTVTDKDGASG